MPRLNFIRYIKAHPFSTMALCNIVGDLGYLGYAFAAEGFVSLPKLCGALFTMAAHVLLLAYGDDQAKIIADEKGALSEIVLALRMKAQNVVRSVPDFIRERVKAKPVGIPFAMLAVNGVGLLVDAMLRARHGPSLAMTDQMIMGVLIILGTGAFAMADFVRGQKTADILTKLAPSILAFASCANILLALTTRNLFVVMSVVAFALSNYAGFYTRIDKEKGQHLHS